MKRFNFKKLFLESFDPKTFPKHLLFGFLGRCLFRSRNGITTFNLKKKNYNKPQPGQILRLRIHPTVQLRKLSLIKGRGGGWWGEGEISYIP